MAYLRSSTLARRAARTALAVAVGMGIGLGAQPARAGEQEVRRYDIEPGTLDQALGRFGRDAGVLVVIDPALTAGLRSDGLRGQYGERAGLDALLAGSGLEAVPAPQGGYRLRRAARAPGAVSTLAPVTVTADRVREAAVYDTPGSVATVTREQMERLPPRNVGDVLGDVSGVYAVGNRQNGALSVNIRGMQDFGRVNVMIDGTRQNYQQSGHGSNGAAYIDTELLAGVDVAKGPTSTAGGAAVIGGVVNFRTLDPEDLLAPGATHGAQATVTTGTNAYQFSSSAVAAVRAAPTLDLIAGVSRKQLGTFEPGTRGGLSDNSYYRTIWPSYLSSQEYWSGLAKASWRLSPTQRLKLSYLGFDARRELGRNGDGNSHVRRDTLIGNYSWKPGDARIDLAASLYYTRTRNREQRAGSDMLGYGLYDVRYQTSTVGGSVENAALFDLGGAELSWRAGGEFFHDWTEPQAQSGGPASPDNAFNPVWFTGSTPKGQRTVASLFSEATVRRGNWLELTGGLRYDWYGIQGDGKIMAGDIANPPGVRPGTTYIWTAFGVDRNASAISPRLTLALRPWEPLQLFASVGRGMRPPAITESLQGGAHPGNLMLFYPNPSLREERARNWEVGANLILRDVAAANDSLKLKAAWFDNKVRHYMAMAIVKSPAGDSGEGTFAPRAYVNLDDPFRSRGLELQADYDAGTVFGSLSYTHLLVDTGQGGYDPYPLGSVVGAPPTSLGKPGDGRIGYLLPPRKTAAISLGVRLFERRLTLGSRLRLRSPQRHIVAEQFQDLLTAQSAGAQIVDLWASIALGKALTLRLAIDNATDRNYAEMSGGLYFLAPGRTVTATLAARF